MRKSKIRYLFNIIIAALLIVNFVCFKPKSYYDNEKIITGIVLKKTVKEDKVSLVESMLLQPVIFEFLKLN